MTIPRAVLATAMLCLYASAGARELYPGQYAQVDPATRQWFRNQVSPSTGLSCCSEADGIYAEEDIRDGQYWVRFEHTHGEWMRVPPEVVIRDPNRNGAPVVWWYFENGAVKVRCYSPGGGV